MKISCTKYLNPLPYWTFYRVYTLQRDIPLMAIDVNKQVEENGSLKLSEYFRPVYDFTNVHGI